MATPIAARLRPDSSAPPTLVNRLHVLLIERRVAISLALFTSLILVDALLRQLQPHDVLNLADPCSAAGLALVLAGLLVRSWAAGTLRKSKQLITTGPYALVRNPLYAGSFLMMAGFCTLIGDVLTGLLIGGPMVLVYWLAVRDEEQILAQFFPDQWPEYSARVPRFLPRLVPRMTVRAPAGLGWSLTQWRCNDEFNAWLGTAAALAGLRIWWMISAIALARTFAVGAALLLDGSSAARGAQTIC
jgi:protein-S-isoprenylcysteine O-methyltransferase Ste14